MADVKAPAQPDQAALLGQMRADNDAAFARSMEMNRINKQGDAQKELAAGIGNAQKSAHDAMMALIANLK